MFIYVIVCSETLKIYIGQHKGNNLQKYLQTKQSNARRNSGTRSHLFAAMRKHPKDSWSIHPLVSDLQTREECDYWEKLLIKALKAQHPEVGYNICRGGEGFSGPHTSAALKKMSRAHGKTFRTPERRQIAEERFTKMWADPEKKKEISQAIHEAQAGMKARGVGLYGLTAEEMRTRAQNAGLALASLGPQPTRFQSGHTRGAGIPLSAEHRQKLSAARLGRKQPDREVMRRKKLRYKDHILRWHAQGKSLKWIAKRVGVSRQTVCDWLQGKPSITIEQRREQGRRGAHIQSHIRRGITNPNCKLCQEVAQIPNVLASNRKSFTRQSQGS